MNTRDALLRFMSNAVPRAVGTTAEQLVRTTIWSRTSKHISLLQPQLRPEIRTSHEVILPPHLDGTVRPLGLEEDYEPGEPRLQREVHGVHQQRRRELAQLVPQ